MRATEAATGLRRAWGRHRRRVWAAGTSKQAFMAGFVKGAEWEVSVLLPNPPELHNYLARTSIMPSTERMLVGLSLLKNWVETGSWAWPEPPNH